MIVRSESLSKAVYTTWSTDSHDWDISVVPTEVIEVRGGDRLEEIMVQHHDTAPEASAAAYSYSSAPSRTEWLDGVMRATERFLTTGTNLEQRQTPCRLEPNRDPYLLKPASPACSPSATSAIARSAGLTA
jgi:hypothetical protein